MTTTFPTTIAEGDTVPEPFDWANSVGGVLNDLQAFAAAPTAPTASPGDSSSAAASTEFVTLANGLLIPKSLVTAKGDLIGASASGTPARIPVGSDGQVLTADSTQTNGVKWAAAAGGGGSPYNFGIVRLSGRWYTPLSNWSGNNTAVAGTLWCLPFLGAGDVIKGIACRVTTLGTSVVRLGIYNGDGPGGIPGTRLLDAGSVANTSTGNKIITLGSTITLPARTVWLCAVSGDATAVYATGNSTAVMDFNMGGSTNPDNQAAFGMSFTGYTASSALPATATTAGQSFVTAFNGIAGVSVQVN